MVRDNTAISTFQQCLKSKEFQKLEQQIAKFHGREDAILYASCFDANAGLFEQILGPEDAVFSDALNHASIIDGIRLCKAKKNRYEHKNMEGTKTFKYSTYNQPSFSLDLPLFSLCLFLSFFSSLSLP